VDRRTARRLSSARGDHLIPPDRTAAIPNRDPTRAGTPIIGVDTARPNLPTATATAPNSDETDTADRGSQQQGHPTDSGDLMNDRG
jgi:hypothetical protein